MAEPHLLLRSLARQEGHLVTRHDANVPLGELSEAGVVEHAALRPKPRKIVRRWRGGHRILVLDAALISLEGRGHREDRLAVLNRTHPSGRERPTVAQPFDQID